MKLENYKVRVSNESESKEVQELFFELGYHWSDNVKSPKYLEYPVITSYEKNHELGYGISLDEFHYHQNKELTIQQLRNLVAAKTKKAPYLVKTIDKWEEQHLTSDTPESATCLRIPDGADNAVLYKTGIIEFFKSDFRECYHGDRFKWFDCSKAPKFYTLGDVIWQRSTHPEELPFIDDEPKHDDNVNHPSHYTQGSIECIEALEAATVNKQGIEAVCVSNIIKYLWRYESKNGLEDVKKAQWYLQKLVDKLEQNNE